MKKNLFSIIVILLVFIGVDSFAQNKKVKRAEFNNLTKSGSYTEYVAKMGNVLKIGDTLQIGVPTNFERYVYLTQNDGYLRAEQINKKIIIKNINVSGDAKKGFDVFFTMKGLGATPVFVKYEDALQTKEIILLNDTQKRTEELL